MRFLLDAHVPPSLATVLAVAGHDTVHISGVLNGWTTGDREIATFADAENRVIVSKDKDFRNLQLAVGVTRKLLRLRIGNIANRELLQLVGSRIDDIALALDAAEYVELHRTVLVANRGPDGGA